MRKVDESRAANYIRKHSNYKKWLAFVLCLSLLTGTVTLYILNKPATAMTEEGAESLGVVLETASNADEEELIQQTLENKVESDEGGDDDDLFSEFNEDGEDESDDELEESGDDEEKQDDLVEEEVKEGELKEGELTEEEEQKEETEEEEDELTQDVVLTVSYVDEDGEAIAEEKEIDITDSIDLASEAPSIEGYTFKEATFKGDVITKVAVKKNADDIRYYEVTFDGDETKEIKKDAAVVLTYTADEKKEIVLTASYVDEDGKEIADEKELEISESFDPKMDADPIEGYTFKEAKIDENVLVLITAKEDEESGEKFYEATLKDESVVEIKENTTITLTCVAVDTTVVLTAKFVDRNGEEFQESKDLNIGDGTELKKSKITEVDGYFFYKAIYEEKEITKIAPIFEEEKKDTDKDDAETESKAEKSDEERTTVKATGYKFTTVDGEEIEITEDAEIELTFLKASTETEFTFSDGKVTVTATINGKNVFPEGIELKAVEVTKDSSSYNYDAYMDALNQNAEAIANEAGKDNADEFTEDNTLLYDIAFEFEEKEIQPKEGTVSVKIEFNKNQLSEDIAALSDEDIAVVHLPIKEEVKEENEITNTDEAKDISSGDIEVITLTDATAAVGEAEKVEFEADSFSIFAVLAYQNHEPGTDTFETVLGDAVNFGVVAQNFSQIEHAQTNFAAIKFNQGGSSTGNDMTNPVEQTFIVGEIENNTVLINGQPAFFILPKGCESKIGGNAQKIFDTSYSYAQIEGIVKDMLSYTKAASKDLATRHQSSYETIYVDGDQSKKGFDFSKYQDGTYYLTVDEQFRKDYLYQDEKLFIKKNPGQTIVFNVVCDGEVGIHKYKVDNGDGFVDTATLEGTRQDHVASTLIWNFINASKVTSEGSVAGVFISGRDGAKWDNLSTSGGWVAFDNVSLPGGGEWHNTYYNIRQINGTAELQAYKTINGIGANVTGFTFTLYKQDATAEGGWKAIESKTNDPASPHSIVFSPITYGDDSRNTSNQYQYVRGDEETFTYKIVETQGALDINNNTYIADTREYYATVGVVKENYSQQAGRVVYRVSTPKYYYLDGEKVVELSNTTFLERDGVDENGNPKYREVDSNKLPVFNNKTSGKLSIRKEWKDMEGNDDENPSVTVLDVSILRRVVNTDGTFGEWKTYKNVQLTQNNSWTWSSETDNVAIDLVNENGLSYQYTVKEDDKYLREFTVKYNYGGKDYLADLLGNLTWIDENGNPVPTDAYLMEATEADYGVVTITNQRIVRNALPSTGGLGDLPYMAAGAGTAMVGLLGTGLYYRKKKDDDQEEE